MSIPKKNTTKNKKHKYLAIIPIFITLLSYYFMLSDFKYSSSFLITSSVLLIIVFLLRWKKKKKVLAEDVLYFLICIGIIIRDLYMIKTPIPTRQHDLGSNYGHVHYIYYIFKYQKLPNVNYGQFYQPPLHHIIAAFWLLLEKIIGVGLEKAIEGIKLLTLLYSTITIIYTKKIVDKMKMKNIFKIIIMSIFIFHPTFIILSSSINNDCLVVMLMTAAIYYLIEWYENPTKKNIILLALTTGLSVMTKSNGALLAVPILYAFAKKFIPFKKTKQKAYLDYLKQIIMFGIISLPIGLWFQIKQFLQHGSYKVPIPGSMNLKEAYAIWPRFFIIDIQSFINSPFCEPIKKDIIDFNLITYIIKNSIFGEFKYTFSKIYAYGFLLINVILIIMSLFYMLSYLFNKKNFICNILLITWVVHMVSFFIFNLKYPYPCSMDFRYIVPTLLPGVIIPAWELKNAKKWLQKTLMVFSILFVLFSITFVILI